MSFLSIFLGFLAGLLLGDRRNRRAVPPPPAPHEWAAFGQGRGPTTPTLRAMETPGRIYLHAPP